MKRKIIGVILSCMTAALMITGCSSPDDATQTIEGMAEQEDKAQDVMDAFAEDAAMKDEQTDEILDSLNAEGDASIQTLSKGGYEFSANSVTMTPDMDFAPVLEALGEPQHYYEVKSCAFEGMDKIYTYPSFEITTYPDGSIDRISYINLKDDTVTTAEGVYLSMSKDKVIEIYGDSYTEDAGVMVYEKGGMELKFIFDADSLTSIEYATEALKDKQ